MSDKSSETNTTQTEEVLGYCYMNRSCTGAKVAEYPISLAECRDLGGGSWQDPDGNCHRL